MAISLHWTDAVVPVSTTEQETEPNKKNETFRKHA